MQKKFESIHLKKESFVCNVDIISLHKSAVWFPVNFIAFKLLSKLSSMTPQFKNVVVKKKKGWCGVPSFPGRMDSFIYSWGWMQNPRVWCVMNKSQRSKKITLTVTMRLTKKKVSPFAGQLRKEKIHQLLAVLKRQLSPFTAAVTLVMEQWKLTSCRRVSVNIQTNFRWWTCE